MSQWAAFLLDRFIAPKFSDVTACIAPDIAELPDYFGSFFVNNAIWASGSVNAPRPLIFLFLRRLTEAIRAYRTGREKMIGMINAQQHSERAISAYLAALGNFEAAIGNAYLALIAHNAASRLVIPASERPFKAGDGSPPQRLNVLYNAIKHFDDNSLKGLVPDIPTPVWLVNDGIECAGSEGDAKLTFTEIAGIFAQLSEDAQFFAEDLFRIALERKKTKPTA